MAYVVLSNRTLLSASAAGAGGVFPTDYRAGAGSETTRVATLVTVTAADSAQVQASFDNVNWFNVGTSMTTAGTSVTWQAPYPYIRVVKTGTAGAMLVQGVI